MHKKIYVYERKRIRVDGAFSVDNRRKRIKKYPYSVTAPGSHLNQKHNNSCHNFVVFAGNTDFHFTEDTE